MPGYKSGNNMIGYESKLIVAYVDLSDDVNR